METYKNEFKKVQRWSLLNRIFQLTLCVVLAITINRVASKHYLRKDITKTHQYSLSPETIAYLRELKEPVNIITTLMPTTKENEIKTLFQDLETILREYQYTSSQVAKAPLNIQYVNIYQQRKTTEELAQKYGTQSENTIYVSTKNNYRILKPSDLYQIENGQVTGFKGEQAITSAILEVTSEQKENAYFIIGHGEMQIEDTSAIRGLSEIYQLFKEHSINTHTIDLNFYDEVPADANCLIIASPQSLLLPEEVQKIRAYLENKNGRVIVFLDAGNRHGLDELFYEWGIISDDMLILDTSKDFQASKGDLILRNFFPHTITQTLIDYQLPVIMGQVRPVRPHPAAPHDERQSTLPLLTSSRTSWGERGYHEDSKLYQFDESVDLKGPIPVATLTERRINSDFGIHMPSGKLIVFGNSDFISNQRLQSLGNKQLFLNTILWALDKNHLVNIASKKIEFIQLTISQNEFIHIALALNILPLGILLMGTLVFLKRRQ